MREAENAGNTHQIRQYLWKENRVNHLGQIHFTRTRKIENKIVLTSRDSEEECKGQNKYL